MYATLQNNQPVTIFSHTGAIYHADHMNAFEQRENPISERWTYEVVEIDYNHWAVMAYDEDGVLVGRL